jgi:hypothetical protein
VEAADHNGDAGLPQGARDVERAGILVRLDPDQRNKPEVIVTTQPGEQGRHVDTSIRFIDRFDFNRDFRPKDLPFRTISRNAV